MRPSRRASPRSARLACCRRARLACCQRALGSGSCTRMPHARSLLLALLGGLAPASAFSEVYELDGGNWHKMMSDDAVWLVKFYAPWCGHCKKFEPVYEQIAEKLHRRNGDVRVGRVDATAHPGIVGPFNLEGYPTVLLLKGGAAVGTYKGARTLEGVIGFVDRSLSHRGHAAAAPAPAPARGWSSYPPSPTLARWAAWRQQTFSLDALRRKAHAIATWATTELEPLQLGLIVLATVLAMAVGLLLLLCLTTEASPR